MLLHYTIPINPIQSDSSKLIRSELVAVAVTIIGAVVSSTVLLLLLLCNGIFCVETRRNWYKISIFTVERLVRIGRTNYYLGFGRVSSTNYTYTWNMELNKNK